MRRLLVIATAVGLVVPSASWADGRRVIRDCTDNGRIDGHYSQSEYRDALAHMPTDVDEYTDCRSVIRRAQLAAAAGPSGGSGGTGSTGTTPASPPPVAGTDPLTAATPTEREGVKQALSGASAPVKVRNGFVRPGALGSTSSAFSDLPTPLLIALVLVGIGALALAGARVRGRVLARRRT